MSAQLCVACGRFPQHWRGICALCAQWLGFAGRRKITEGGDTERRRAIRRIQAHLASFNTVRVKEQSR